MVIGTDSDSAKKQCCKRVGLLVFTLLAALNAWANDASISLQSETTSIFLGDIVILDIESTGLHDALDVSELKQSDEFIRETVGTRIAVQNGQVIDIAIRRMEFIPKREGVFYYGPLRGEGNKGPVLSNTIAVRVQPAIKTEWSPGPADFEGEIRLSTTTPLLGQQLILDVELRHQFPIANEMITLPALQHVDAIPLFEQRRTIVDTDKTWRQTAWRYLLHAKKSGTIELGLLSWSGTLIKSRTQRGAFEFNLAAEPLLVKPSTSGLDEWWLPASSVNLSDEWSQDVKTLSAGDEVIRTITLTANNVLAKQLPDVVPLASRALTSTLIHSTREQELHDTHSVAKAVFKYRMIAQSPIPVFLDTVRVPWWNTETGSADEAIIPARRINVGLPDRKDLLADLALSGSRTAVIAGTLKSFARWQPMLIGFIALLASLLLIPLARQLYYLLMHRRQRHATQSRLRQWHRNKEWLPLYNELNRIEQHSNALLAGGNVDEKQIIYNTNDRDFQHLKHLLERTLFDDKNDASAQLAEITINGPDILRNSAPRQRRVPTL